MDTTNGTSDQFTPTANPGFHAVAGADVWDHVYTDVQGMVRAGGRVDVMQREQHQAGFRGAELVRSAYGWSVRYLSGLDGFALLASSRTRELDGTLADAARWAREWQAVEPTRRYVLVRADRGRA